MLIRTSESGNITMFRAYHVPNHGREGKRGKTLNPRNLRRRREGEGREEEKPICQPHHASRPQVNVEKMDTSTHECASKIRLRIVL